MIYGLIAFIFMLAVLIVASSTPPGAMQQAREKIMADWRSIMDQEDESDAT